jgi:hypothetical protein
MTRQASEPNALRLHGHQVISVCFRCAQAIAPDWPFVILWPFLKISVASSIARLSRSRLSRQRYRGTAARSRQSHVKISRASRFFKL